MTNTFNMDSVPVLFNMDLANGPTSARFCAAAAAVLGEELTGQDSADLDAGEWVHEIVAEWTDRLSDAGYCVFWDAGDVVVYDLRGLSDDQRDAFYRETENY